MAYQLGNKTHDDRIRQRQISIRLSIGRLQSGSRIHRRVYIFIDEIERSQSIIERRPFP